MAFSLNSQSNICFSAKLNDSDTLLMMFHTSSTGVTVTKESLQNKILLKNKQSTNVQTWGGRADSEFSEHNTLKLGSLKWDDMTVFVNENSGPDTDGKFGYDLFKNKIVSLNYDKNTMVVSELLPKNLKGYQKMKLIFEDGSMFIVGTLVFENQEFIGNFMFHTGYGGAILLDPKLGEKYNSGSLPTISTSELKDSYGNVFKIETKLLPKVKLGKKTLKNVPLSFAARSSDIPMKVFGNDLLKRFNVIFDFQKNEVYLKPNRLEKMNYTVKK
ncbi:MAG TPA: aspartyl protease family protein [Leadbetterella sp.]|nr:aspartyl protease family protein [Leadbetterella sp.]